MDQIWLHLLSLSGLLSLALCQPQEYVLIKELATWGAAQEYCRKNHNDLATVQSDEDWATLQEVMAENGYSGYAWIGLHNDIYSWRWSYQEESLVFKSWGLYEPDNKESEENCVGINSAGKWSNRICYVAYPFLCSNESANATEKMVLIQNLATWRDAQTYCRQHYTDLVTIRSLDDQTQVAHYENDQPWIGLYRDSWKWSDQASFTSSTQLAVKNLDLGKGGCAHINHYLDIRMYSCTALYYFFCSTVKKKQQVIRVQVNAGENVDDPTLSALVLHKLQQTLIDQNVTLTWKKQPDGKVFQKTPGNKTRDARTQC